MNSYVVSGVVLKRIETGEADRIVTIYTLQRGKIRVLAKGLRRISSRRSGSLEIFNMIKARIVEGRSLDIITEVEVQTGFRPLRKNITSVGTAYQLVEIVDKLSSEKMENAEVFGLLKEALERVSHGTDSQEIVINNFAVGTLKALGFWPRDKNFDGDWQKYVEQISEYPLRSARILTRLTERLKSK